MATTFPTKNGVLQGDLDAADFTILNLDLTGLNLTKASVGLGNVDNTSDANKPVSTLQAAAIALKEPVIAAGTSAQYWRGDKTWQTLGALGLQGGATTLQELSAIGLNATGSAFVAAKRNDWDSSSADIAIAYFGASYAGSLLGLSAANAGALRFQNASAGFIYSNGLCPIVFGYNGIRRMRLMTGLNVGGDTDPGAGCISASGDITAGGDITGDSFVGDDLTVTGDVACQDLACSGSSTFAGAVTTTLGVNVGQNLAVGGNMAVTGAIVNFANLPTSNPGVAGQLWRSTNTVMVSTG